MWLYVMHLLRHNINRGALMTFQKLAIHIDNSACKLQFGAIEIPKR